MLLNWMTVVRSFRQLRVSKPGYEICLTDYTLMYDSCPFIGRERFDPKDGVCGLTEKKSRQSYLSNNDTLPILLDARYLCLIYFYRSGGRRYKEPKKTSQASFLVIDY